MKKNLYHKLITGIILSFSILSIDAQEIIYEPQFIKDDFSIVREIGKNNWIVSNNYEGRTTIAYIDLSGTVRCLERGNFYYPYIINDIKVVDSNYIFYCGKRATSYELIQNPDESYSIIYNWVAVMGYFGLSSFFSSPNVQGFSNLCNTIGIESLDKMEVYHVDSAIHVTMVGSQCPRTINKQAHNSVIIDAFYSYSLITPSWDFQVYTNGNEEFDDLSVSDDLIVVSSREMVTQPVIRSFKRPGLAEEHMTHIPSVGKKIINYPVQDTILVEHCENNYFTIASTNTDSGRVAIVSFDPFFNIYYALSFPLHLNNHPDWNLRDIKYNTKLQALSILENASWATLPCCIIHHIDASNGPSTFNPTISGNAYYDESLNSLEYLNHNQGHEIASGHLLYPHRTVRLYQFFPNIYNHCTVEHSVNCTPLSLETANCGTLSYENYIIGIEDIPWDISQWPEEIICK